MAIDISHYNSGTATVAANGTAVTGQGTTWAGAVRAGDMFGTHRGDGVRIASVNSNTSLTLAYPWSGGAQTAAAYEIQRTPYDIGYQKAVEDLLLALQDGNIPALAAITGAANTLPYFTGPDTMDATGLTAFARTLLDDANAGAMRGTLGLGSYALENVGAFGWGADGSNVAIPDNNADTLTLNGVWRTTTSVTGTPGELGQLIHMGQGANVAFQLFIGNSTQSLMTRYRNTSGVWTAWKSYEPEYGSNANGSFVRFPGGLQLCYHYDTSSVADTRTWTYPAAFNASTFPQATPIQGVSVPRTVHFVTRGATSANYRVYDQSGSASNTNVSLMAWGTY